MTVPVPPDPATSECGCGHSERWHGRGPCLFGYDPSYPRAGCQCPAYAAPDPWDYDRTAGEDA